VARFRDPEPLGRDHALDGFDCGRASLNVWLMKHARQADAAGSARTYVVVDSGHEHVVGCHAVAAAGPWGSGPPERQPLSTPQGIANLLTAMKSNSINKLAVISAAPVGPRAGRRVRLRSAAGQERHGIETSEVGARGEGRRGLRSVVVR